MKIEISKKCDINILKGTNYRDFKTKPNFKKGGFRVFKIKNKQTIKYCIICNSKKLNLIPTILKIEFYNANDVNMSFLNINILINF